MRTQGSINALDQNFSHGFTLCDVLNDGEGTYRKTSECFDFCRWGKKSESRFWKKFEVSKVFHDRYVGLQQQGVYGTAGIVNIIYVHGINSHQYGPGFHKPFGRGPGEERRVLKIFF